MRRRLLASLLASLLTGPEPWLLLWLLVYGAVLWVAVLR